MRIEDLCPISSTDDQCSCNLDDLAETCELKLGNCYCSVDVLLVSDYIMPIFSNHIGGGVSQRKKFFIGENINRFYFSLLDFNLLDREKQKLNSPHSTCNHLYEANLLFNNQFCVLDFWCVMWHSGQLPVLSIPSKLTSTKRSNNRYILASEFFMVSKTDTS